MRGFRRVGQTYVAGLDGSEREVLSSVVADVAELLGAGRFGSERRIPAPGEAATTANPLLGLHMSSVAVPAPVDPAVHRLLPDASDDDPELAAEFRRLTEDDLRALKVDRLRSLWQWLEAPAGSTGSTDLVVPLAEASGLAATITDLRLVLADRLGVETEEDSDALYDALDRLDLGVDDPPDDGTDRTGRELLVDEIKEYLASVYAALSWLQESLLAALLADLP